jgi:hypothetical protein
MVVVGIIISFFIIIFLFNQNKDDKKIKEIGGIQSKFNLVINELLFSLNDSRIERLTNTNVFIVGNYGNYRGTYGSFELSYNFNRLNVFWTFQSPIYGTFTRKWTFDENYNQHLILEEIDLKIVNEMKNIIMNSN